MEVISMWKPLGMITISLLYLTLIAPSSVGCLTLSEHERLFSIPYGEAEGNVYLEVAYGKPEYEPDIVEGPTALLVAPDGSQIAIVAWGRDANHEVVNDVFLYNRNAKFIKHLRFNESQGGVSSIYYGSNGFLYIRTGWKVQVYDIRGNLIESLSKIYTDSFNLFNEEKRLSIEMIGVDKHGYVYFSTGKEIYRIDEKGNGTWIAPPFSSFYPYTILAKGESIIYWITGTPPKEHQKLRNPPSALYEVWNNAQGRFQRLCTVPSDPKIVAQLKQQYKDILFRRATASGLTYWEAVSHADLNWVKIVTTGGRIHTATADILVFDQKGRLVSKVPYFVANTVPVGRDSVQEWDIDANGNIYYLKWAEKALEVWWVPISSSPSAQQSNK